jgi:hypothetical protein
LIECIKPKERFQQDKDVWQLLFAHVGQSYFLNFEIEIKGLPDKCKSDEEFRVKTILMHEEYYDIMGKMMLIMSQMLKKAMEGWNV